MACQRESIEWILNGECVRLRDIPIIDRSGEAGKASTGLDIKSEAIMLRYQRQPRVPMLASGWIRPGCLLSIEEFRAIEWPK